MHAGTQLVFVSGNHDSDALERQLARAGAIVLTRAGRLLPNGTYGPLIVKVGGLRIAGYDDPLKRLAADGYKDNGATPTKAQQEAFAAWLNPLIGKIDVVMVHEPGLAKLAMDVLREVPPQQPLLVVWGHTHALELKHDANAHDPQRGLGRRRRNRQPRRRRRQHRLGQAHLPQQPALRAAGGRSRADRPRKRRRAGPPLPSRHARHHEMRIV